MENEFLSIAEQMIKTDLKIDNDDMLILYGYYKQATIGDCNISKPSMFNPRELAKYDAWINNNGVNKKNAMQRYIRKAKLLLK